MTAIYAPPVIVLGTDEHSHGHGHRHGHGHGHGHLHGSSHSQKSIAQRIPLQPTSINGGLPLNGGPIQTNPLKPHTHSYSVPERPQTDSGSTKPGKLEPSLPPPSINSSLINSNSRPKSMERRRSSVGLPTHLRLGSSGYGFPQASSQKYVSTNDDAKRKWITFTEAISSVVVPLPYILTSFAYGPQSIRQHMPQHAIASQLRKIFLENFSSGNTKLPIGDRSLLSACALTSITLLLVGVKGKLSSPPVIRDRRKNPQGKSNKTTAMGARRIVERTLGVGLPFYATMKLGTDRVGLIMLVALAAGITNIENETTDLKSIKGWKSLIMHRRWTLISITIQVLCDFIGLTSHALAGELCIGYIALALSILILPPPFPSLKSKHYSTSSFSVTPASPVSRALAAQWESRTQAKLTLAPQYAVSPLLSTSQDIDLTLAASIALGALTCIIFFFSMASAGALPLIDMGFGFLSACAAALSFQFAQPQSIRQNSGLGLVLSSVLFWALMAILRSDTWSRILYQGAFISVSFAAIKLDNMLSLSKSSQSERQTLHQHQHTSQQGQPSRFSEILIRSCQHWPLLHSILVEKDSRRIFYFMSLNFAFMLVQTFYGIASGSLGLLSDSIHMFFDCIALIVGLCAAVMSKWPPSAQFPYGYGKMDTLAGFANGIFLMLISIEIVYEAIERLAEGTEMQRIGELLTVSTLGLAVNLVGITAFGHAHHGHSHGGHDHSDHSHAGHEHETGHSHEGHHHHHDSHNHDHLHDHLHAHPTPSPHSSIPATPLNPPHTHSHSHSHKHHHGNENMHGIFLHILADTLGSVAVVISTLLIHFYGWAGFDPLASCLIAILIFASAIPLVTSSARTLLLTVPEDTEFDLREALAGISVLRGVVGYAVPKFWLEEGEERKVLGVIHVVAAKGADMEDVKERAIAFLRGRNMEVVVQVERDGSDRCWCRGGTKV